MKRTYKLSCDVEDSPAKLIRGSSRDRITGKPVTLFRDTQKIEFRSPDPKLEEEQKVWQQIITAYESTGRTSPQLNSNARYSHKKLFWIIEAFDDIKEIEALKSVDSDMYKVELLNHEIVKFLTKYAMNVDFKNAQGESINPNFYKPDKMWEMTDVTAAQTQEYDNEMLYVDLITEMNTLFMSDIEQFKDVCYGFGMRDSIQTIQNPKGLITELSKLIKKNPQAFKDYFDVKDDKIKFEKAVTAGIITHEGNTFFMNEEPLGTSREESINWLKLHPKSYEYLNDKLTLKMPSKGDAGLVDIEDFRRRTKFPSQFSGAVVALRNKYKGEALEEVEKLLQERSEKMYAETQNERWLIPVTAQ